MSDDERLRRLLADAVCDIDPPDRIHELRARVGPSPTPAPAPVRGRWHAATSIVATAAVIGVVAYVTHVAGDHSRGVGPATAVDTGEASVRAVVPAAGPAAVYCLGAGPHGPVLFRELRPRPASMTRVAFALAALTEPPDDHAYRTAWRPGWLPRATIADGLATVTLGPVPAARPASMTRREAQEALQQVVYTLQAATGLRTRVDFVRRGLPVTSVLGVDTTAPLTAADPERVLSAVSIGVPQAGARGRPGRLAVSGTSPARVSVVVRLVRQGVTFSERRLAARPATSGAAGSWRVVLDTRSVPPGRYTVVATVTGPGGVEGRDSRAVVVG